MVYPQIAAVLASQADIGPISPPPPPPPSATAWDPLKKPAFINLSTSSYANDTAGTPATSTYGVALTLGGFDQTFVPVVAQIVILVNQSIGALGFGTFAQDLGPNSNGYLGNSARTGAQLSPDGSIFFNNTVQGVTGPTFGNGDQITMKFNVATMRITWANGAGPDLPAGGFDASTFQPSGSPSCFPVYAGVTLGNDAINAGSFTILSSNFP